MTARAFDTTVEAAPNGKARLPVPFDPDEAWGPKAVHHVGGIGLGQAAKLAQNLQNAVIFESFAEGLALATKLGVPPETLVGIVKSTMTKSGVVEYKAPFVLGRDFSRGPEARSPKPFSVSQPPCEVL